jgi:hypothetical protein
MKLVLKSFLLIVINFFHHKKRQFRMALSPQRKVLDYLIAFVDKYLQEILKNQKPEPLKTQPNRSVHSSPETPPGAHGRTPPKGTVTQSELKTSSTTSD